MEIRTEKRVIEVEDKIYIAEDGKEFATENDCRKHEADLEKERLKTEADKLEITSLYDLIPIDTEGYIVESNEFKWYKVNNTEELNVISDAYNEDFGELNSYPEIVCIESTGFNAYIMKLSDMKKATIDFWKRHGFNVEFKEI